MANNIIKKTILIKGDKGDTGETQSDITAPIGAMFYFNDETETPEGYEEIEI